MSTTGRLSGRSGSLTIGATTFHVKNWEAEIMAEALETTDSSSGSYREYIEGLVSGTVSCDFNYDTTAMPHAQAAIKRGATSSITCTAGNSTKTITGSLLIERVRYRNDTRGLFEGSLSGKFTGTITEPT